MTREEAQSCIKTIELLRRLAYNIHGVMDVIDAKNCEKIIEALSREPSEDVRCSEISNSSDCINRQAAIDCVTYDVEHTIECLKALPSAQPEIIRCKECKHRDPEDKKCDCGHDIIWQLPRHDDWHCADAERRTDG